MALADPDVPGNIMRVFFESGENHAWPISLCRGAGMPWPENQPWHAMREREFT